MSDRELLELAAKAAGIGHLDFDYAEREGHHIYMGPRLPMPQGVLMAAMHTYWRPLEDDGDALRLAATLHIDLEWQATCPFPEATVEAYRRDPEGQSHFCASELETDYRRAIVRAAADIGKSAS